MKQPSLRIQLILGHFVLAGLLLMLMGAATATLIRGSGAIEQSIRNRQTRLSQTQVMRESLADEQEALTIALVQPSIDIRPILFASQQAFNKAASDELANQATDGDAVLIKTIQLRNAALLARANDLLGELDARNPTQRVQIVQTLKPMADEVEKQLRKLTMIDVAHIAATGDMIRLQAKQTFIRVITATLLALFLSGIIATKLIRAALAPLEILAHHAERIGRGDLTESLQLNRTDEIGALAISFDTMAQNLAELRKSERRRLQRAEQISHAAMESLYDPVIVADARARIIRMNPAAESLFGAAPENPRVAVRDHIQDEAISRAIETSIAESRTITGRDEAQSIRLQHQESLREFRIRVTPMRNEDGLISGAVAVLEDVTYLKELDRMKNDFIGVASHELRTPVTSLLLSTQLLEEGAVGPLTPPQLQLIKSQTEELERLHRLMEDLLNLSKMDSGHIQLDRRVTPAGLLILDTQRACWMSAQNAQIELKIDDSAHDAMVLVDVDKMTRCLINLTSNAIRHTPRGGQVIIRARKGPHDVEFQVEDSGEGIPEEYLNKIFERFVQVPGATRGGVGLGLSIAQEILHAHESELHVESEPGKGSIFSFRLGFAPAEK